MLNDFPKLQKHLSTDLFHSKLCGDTLYIIDDYNVDSNMTDEMLQDFVKIISGVKQIKHVKIYIQKKYSRRKAEVNLFPGKDPKDIEKIRQNCTKKIQFIEAFMSHGIECSYIIYPKMKHPFHGRYWLSQTNGFIVDGSINTAQSKMVLVQVMDQENYDLISDMTKNLFAVNKCDIDEYGLKELNEMFEQYK